MKRRLGVHLLKKLFLGLRPGEKRGVFRKKPVSSKAPLFQNRPEKIYVYKPHLLCYTILD